jgi:hypothetical protein
MSQRAGLGATLLATALGVAAVVVLIFGGIQLNALAWVLAGLCIVAVLTRFDVALTWCSVVVFGSIFLFQVATIPTGLKAAFIVLAALLAVWALFSLIRRMPELNARARTGVVLVFWAVGIITVFLMWQMVALLWNQVTIDAWLRDSLNYLLIPMAILIGVEAGFRLIPRVVSVLALLAGLVGAYSFSIAWLGRRTAEQGGDSQQFGLASSFVVFATLALCLARFASGRLRSLVWLVSALLLMGIMVVAGGRQTIVQCAIALLVAIAIGGGGVLAKAARVLTGVGLAAVAFTMVLNFSASSTDPVAVGRFAFFQRFMSDGFSAITNDQSAQARLRALDWLIQQWSQKPLFGWGFGHDMISVATGQIATNVFTLDSPLVPLEKFGVVGTAVLVIALAIFFAALWKLARLTGPQPIGTDGGTDAETEMSEPASAAEAAGVHPVFGRAFWMLVTVLTLVTLVNGFPPENRGFPTFLLLSSLIAVSNSAIASHKARAEDDEPEEPESPQVAAPAASAASAAPAASWSSSPGSSGGSASFPKLPWVGAPDPAADDTATAPHPLTLPHTATDPDGLDLRGPLT